MNNKGKLSASMMCASIDRIFYYLTEFKEVDLEYLHIDIMDGVFVPNLALGTDFIKSLRRVTDIPFDYHFLVNQPEIKMQWFDIRPTDQVAFHYESTQNIGKCIEYVKSKGAKVLIAINPETSYLVLEEYLDDIDGILVMTVSPGFAGKKIVPYAFDKVKEVKKYLISKNKDNIEITVDGNISIENAQKLYDCGARTFVAGSSSLFSNTQLSLKEIINLKRKAIGW